MEYQIVDLISGDVIGDFDTERDALTAVRNAVMEHGRAAITKYALFHLHEGVDRLIAANDDLLDRAGPGLA